MTKQEIGEVLKTARLAAGFTQAHVASLLNRKPQVVGHWETGYAQPDANTLFELCDIYGISIDEAFGKKNNQETPSPAALEFARRFEKLDRHAQEVLLAVMRIEEKRCEDQAMARNYLTGSDVPIIGEAIADGSVEARYAARKEVREITADPIPQLRENK